MRKLRFKNLNEALSELDTLKDTEKNKTSGNWTSGQIFKHCRMFIEYSMTGFPKTTSNFIRGNVGPTLFRNMKTKGYMPSGFRNRHVPDPEQTASFDEEKTALKAAIVRFMNYSGRCGQHPVFGPLERTDWDLYHSFHLANHLSNIIPEKSKTAKKKTGSKKKAKKKETVSAKKKTKKKASKKLVKKTAKKKK